MEETHKSEKGAFLDIIELLRKENSFLSKENELLQKQIELYRSEKKVNEQRNLSYQRKLEYVLKIISAGHENYDNRELQDENGEQNYDDNKSDNAFRQIQDGDRESINDNSEQKLLLQTRKYEHEQQQDENRHQQDEQELQRDAHEMLTDDNEQNSNEYELQSDDNKQSSEEYEHSPDGNAITSISNKDRSDSYIHDQYENENRINENEELSGRNIKLIQSQLQPQKGNKERDYDNERMPGSNLKPVNENDNPVDENVKRKKSNEDVSNEYDSASKGNVKKINENVKPVRGDANSSGSLRKTDNGNEVLTLNTLRIKNYENKEYKEFVKILYENLKVSFSKKYIKKMMDRYVREMIFLMGNKKVSLGELCTAMNTSVSTMMRDLAIFKRKGWVKYYGTSKFGYYRITDEGMKMGEERAVDS